MQIFTEALPLALYIHLPWCVHKCPYCDFNSHALSSSLPEEAYTQALLTELAQYLPYVFERKLISIFFGGGTPSLFSAFSIRTILDGVAKLIPFQNEIEITLEANPGTVEQKKFAEFREVGINRLSLGIQSLDTLKLKQLGRIHDANQALSAIHQAKLAGFNNLNIDLMYGLPQQTVTDALADLKQAIETRPTHLSWYQLTLEPNTVFYKHPPVLPNDELTWEMQLEGQKLLSQHAYHQYEVSAYCLVQKHCQHNLNYWQFGDYLGIGAGAHGKITDHNNGKVMRFAQIKQPKDYLHPNKRRYHPQTTLTENDLIFEFMLNTLRLTNGVSIDLFEKRTKLPFSAIEEKISLAKQKKLLMEGNLICPTDLGKQFLNDLITIFF